MKLTLEALKERADAVASEELLLSISGGTDGDCHAEEETEEAQHRDLTPAAGDPHSVSSALALGYAISDWLQGK